MATVRRRKVKHGGRTYGYWVVDFTDRGRRRLRHFKSKPAAILFKAEIERQIALAQYAGLEVPLGPPDMTTIEWLDRFAQAVRPNCSDAYHRIIIYTLRQLRDFLASRGVYTTRGLLREHLVAYVEHERGRGLKPHSVANILQVLKRAVHWGVDEGVLDGKLARGLPTVKVPKSRRRVLSEEEVEDVLELFAQDQLCPVVLTALYTGMRRGELVNVRCEHVNLATGIISLPGSITKNNRPREIAIHNRLRPILASLVNGHTGPVFTRHTAGTSKSFKADYVSRHFSEIASKADGLENLTFHCLRHTCATRLAAAGMSPFDVQRVMGHQSIQTTMIYVNLAKERPPDMNVLH